MRINRIMNRQIQVNVILYMRDKTHRAISGLDCFLTTKSVYRLLVPVRIPYVPHKHRCIKE